MNPNINHWTNTCAERLDPDELKQDQTVDLCVIGAGFTGCSAGLTAAKQGARVAVIEAHHVGYGGSGRNVGLVNAGLWLPPDRVDDTLGTKAGQRLNAALSAGPDLVFALVEKYGIECEATRKGTLHLAHSKGGFKDLQSRHTQAQARSYPVDLLSADELAAKIGITPYKGALLDHRAGTIQPMGYVTGLARATQELGAKIYEQSRCTSISRNGDLWDVHCGPYRIKTTALLMATNAYSQKVTGKDKSPFSSVNYFQIALKNPVNIRKFAYGCWDTATIMSSLRWDQSGHFIYGAMGKPDSLGAHYRWAMRQLRKSYRTEEPPVAFWHGRIAMTHDKLPRIIKFGPNAIEIMGYSGRGIAPGSVFGRAAAMALLSGQYDDMPLDVVDNYRESWAISKSFIYEGASRIYHFL